MKEKFKIIGNKKSSGIYGNSLELHFGLKVNSSKTKDVSSGDIKTHLIGSSSLTTLFSRTPKGALTKDFIKKYGKFENGKYSFNASLTNKLTNVYNQNIEFAIYVDRINQKVYLKANEELTDFFWNFDEIYQALEDKINNIHFFYIKPIDNDYAFIEKEIYYVNLDKSKFIDFIEDGLIIIGFACSLKNNKIRNHGCTFRINHALLENLYEKDDSISLIK